MDKDGTKRVELRWPGKQFTDGELAIARDPPASIRIVEKVRGNSPGDDGADGPGRAHRPGGKGASDGMPGTGWTNKLVWGENKAVMTTLLAEYRGLVDLVYIDPPFATGTDYSFTTAVGDDGRPAKASRRGAPVEEKAYQDTWGGNLAAYLQMMQERLALVYQLLSEKGMLYVHCDWRAVHYLKVMLDSIFGHSGDEREEAGFKSEIIWFHQVIGMPRTNAFYFPKQHETILAYSKSRKDKLVFNSSDKLLRKEFSQSIKKAIKTDEHGNKYYKRGRTGTKNEWAYDPKYLQTKVNLEDGVLVADVWDEWKSYQPRKDEKTGYPTQKPEHILERIIAASTMPGDLVADFFCGSGTTLSVAERLGRRWIGSDIGRLAIHTAHKRLMTVEGHLPFDLLQLGDAPGRRPAGEQGSAGPIATRAELGVELQGKVTRVELATFTVLQPDRVPKGLEEVVSTWHDYVDYWAVDFDYEGETFVNRWCSYRTRQDRTMAFISAAFEYTTGGMHEIRARIVDVFGGTAIVCSRIEVSP